LNKISLNKPLKHGVYFMKSRFLNMKFLLQIVVILITPLFLGTASAQKYPDRPIKVVIPYPAGAIGDIIMRMVGQRLTDKLGQPVIIDNRPGGSGLAATEAVAKSLPDGYTLLLNGPNHVTNLGLFSKVPYDPVLDFSPITSIADAQVVLVAHKSAGINTIQQLVESAKKNPGVLNYGSSGSGTGTHLAAEMLSRAYGIKLTHIPYKGGSPAIVGQAAGQVQVSFAAVPLALNFIKNGTLIPLAIGGDQRLSALPNVPSFKDLGIMDYDVEIWFGLLAPKNTPAPIVNMIYEEIRKYVAEPAVIEKFSNMGLTPIASSPSQFSDFIKEETKRWPQLIRELNITVD
jgi:tripartite-type tricarboxylate transporter receptor subunit TctC